MKTKGASSVGPALRGLSLAGVNLHVEQLAPSASPSHRKVGEPKDDASSAINLYQDSWMQLQLADRMHWMKGFRANKTGGLVFLDADALKKQQGVVKEVMLQVGAQLLSGKLAVRISLPIRIFEPRTLLERVADGWNYAPTLLKKAALARADPAERLKLVMAFVAGGYHLCVGQHKPFNPILGETYEATYADGARVFLEHVSHHPVRSAFTVTGPRDLYVLSGVYEFESVTSRNSIVNYQIGSAKLEFQGGQVVTYTVPQIKMSGLLLGERVVEIVGSATFEDSANGLRAELTFDANNGFLKKAQADDIKGQIFATKKSTKQPISKAQGSWTSHLQFDGKTYWHVESEPVFEHRPVPNALPSDVRFREDLVALKNGDLALAQAEKLRLEELQRSDGRLRDASKGKRKS